MQLYILLYLVFSFNSTQGDRSGLNSVFYSNKVQFPIKVQRVGKSDITKARNIHVSNQNDTVTANIPCEVGGKKSWESGEKVWCWSNIEIPEYSSKTGVELANGQLFIDSECYEKQVTEENGQLKFSISHKEPYVGNWCSNNFNFRAEVRTAPWNVQHPVGTEEWFGWSYTFGKDYQIDKYNQWMFFQVHGGIVGENPLISLQINAQNFKGALPGEIYVVNAANNPGPNIYIPTGFFPKANQRLNIVVHVIWGDSEKGLLEVWIDNKKVCSEKGRTVFSFHPFGGNAKWGIYKWPWKHKTRVKQSLSQGIKKLETYMGPLRVITRKPDDKGYGANSYSLVVPD